MCDKIHYDSLSERVDAFETRLTNVETRLDDLRRESQDGFKAVANAVATLGNDFNARMNIMEKRIVEEKEKWGGVLREIVKWTARALLATACAAAGVNLVKVFL